MQLTADATSPIRYQIPADFAARNAEALAAVLRGQQPEIVPINLMVDAVLQMEIAGITSDQYYRDFEAQWQAQVAVYRRFAGLVPVMPFYYPCIEASALGQVDVHWAWRSAPMIRPCIFSESDVQPSAPAQARRRRLDGRCRGVHRALSAEVGRDRDPCNC